MYIESIDINGIQMSNIVTSHRKEIWERYLKSESKKKYTKESEPLTSNKLKDLIEGTQVHRRLSSQMQCVVSSEISDSNSDEEDPDYVPGDESEISDNEYESEMELVEEGNVSTLSCNSIGHSCIKEILLKLQTLDNRHNRRSESIDTFIRKYLSCKKNIAKLFKYEMDIIDEEVYKIFDKHLFKMTDSKIVRVNKIFVQLWKMPELLHFKSSDEDGMQYFQPKKLFEIYKNFITSSKYPKEFLVAAVCNIEHKDRVSEWEEKSKIPIQIDVPFLQDTHIIFNYPELSKECQQLEMWTFDYTHILNNLRYHICNRGFVGISTEAFKNVSKVNHDILPMTIVEDKLDQQNCEISQRLFWRKFKIFYYLMVITLKQILWKKLEIGSEHVMREGWMYMIGLDIGMTCIHSLSVNTRFVIIHCQLHMSKAFL